MFARSRSLAIVAAGIAAIAAGPVRAADAGGFSLHLDPLPLGGIWVDVDTNSAKFEEYRDMSNGFYVPELKLWGGDEAGDRWLDFRAENVSRDDARYTLGYGRAGKYRLLVDYNKIPHRFGNDGKLLWTRTGPGIYELPDPTQAYLQGAIEKQFAANRAGVNFPFLNNLMQPIIATAASVDLGLQRDRTLARLDLGSMQGLAWELEYSHENRTGTRPYGASFGFNNVTELPEPIDYDTTGAALTGAWAGARGGVQFGYRASRFENQVSTMIWDNPFRFTSSTDPGAYSSPGSGSIGGSNRGFADLAPDNDADSLFASGRFRLGGAWWAGGSVTYTDMKQDETLLPYTLNTAIQGIDFDGSTFDPTNPANLPAAKADREAKVLAANADLGTRFAENFGLVFRYRYYDYDNQSRRIEFPGYVRFHAVWEPIARVTAPYSFTKDDIGVELTWDMNAKNDWSLGYNRVSWDRELREVDSTDEDILRLTFDSRAVERFAFRATYEHGDRSISHYDTEAAEATFVEPEGATNLPGLRKYDEAARNYDQWLASVQFFATDTFNVYGSITGRQDDYDESEFGLLADEVIFYNLELDWALGAENNLYVFGTRADRDVAQRGRQSGATPSTNPLDTWSIDFNEINDTWGLGWTRGFGGHWTSDLSAQWAKSDGDADFTAFPGGLPLAPPAPGLPARTEAQDIPNYEDVELTTVQWRLGYKITDRAEAGFVYRYEDYTIDSFITQGLTNYLPGATLIAADNGDYQADIFGLFLSLKF